MHDNHSGAVSQAHRLGDSRKDRTPRASSGDVDRDGDIVDALANVLRINIGIARADLARTGIVREEAWDYIDETSGLLADLCARIGTAIDRGHYRERAGLDQRLAAAGADVAGLRRMLGVH